MQHQSLLDHLLWAATHAADKSRSSPQDAVARSFKKQLRRQFHVKGGPWVESSQPPRPHPKVGSLGETAEWQHGSHSPSRPPQHSILPLDLAQEVSSVIDLPGSRKRPRSWSQVMAAAKGPATELTGGGSQVRRPYSGSTIGSIKETMNSALGRAGRHCVKVSQQAREKNRSLCR